VGEREAANMDENEAVVDEFARLVMRFVRDEAVRRADALFTNNARTGQRWREIVATAKPEAAIREVIPDIVDAAVDCLLDAIDQELLPLYFRLGEGEPVELCGANDTPMLAWYRGDSDSWLARFAKERYHDDLA
jgi:hypothetical protein